MSKTTNPLERYLTENPNEQQSEEMNLLQRYYGSAQDSLNQNLKTNQETLAKNRNASIQKADIAYAKAQRYLPLQNKMNGLSGLGVSETASLDMYNRYANNRAGIDSAYNDANTQLMTDYNTQSGDLFRNYMTDRSAQLDREYQRTWNEEQRAYERAEAERLEKKQDQQREADHLKYLIESRQFSDMESLGKMINEAYWTGKISEADYKNLQGQFEYARTSEAYADVLGNTHHDWEALRANAEEGRKPLTESLKSEGFEGWSAADLGGNYVGAFNNDAVVVAPDGQKMTIDELYEKLTTEEGMTEDEAEDIIVKLQKKLGIVEN